MTTVSVIFKGDGHDVMTSRYVEDWKTWSQVGTGQASPYNHLQNYVDMKLRDDYGLSGIFRSDQPGHHMVYLVKDKNILPFMENHFGVEFEVFKEYA